MISDFLWLLATLVLMVLVIGILAHTFVAFNKWKRRRRLSKLHTMLMLLVLIFSATSCIEPTAPRPRHCSEMKVDSLKLTQLDTVPLQGYTITVGSQVCSSKRF